MVDAARTYWLIARVWSRAAWQYPASLALLTLISALSSTLDLAVIWLIFRQVDTLADFGVGEVMFLYGTAGLSFGLAELFFGRVEEVGQLVRTGNLDVMLLRPASLLAQVASELFSPRRLSRLVQPLAVLAISLSGLSVSWTTGRVLMVPAMVLGGLAIFGSLHVLGAAVQFIVIDARMLINSVTYGGAFLTQYPMAIYGRKLVHGLTWIVPLAFVNWQPALYVLDRPDPFGLPDLLRYAAPVVALGIGLLAAAAWRAGLRRYQSTGS